MKKVIIAIGLILCLPLSGFAQEINVAAAASLADALTAIAKEFEKKEVINVSLNFGGSGALRTQIEKGMPCDIFISADNKNAQQLIDKGLINQQDKYSLLQNSLVVITAVNNTASLNNLTDLPAKINDYLSLGDPDTVPAGNYAKEALLKAGVWEKLESKLALGMDVRAAMLQVENGNAEYGIVYKTDAMISKKLKILYEIPAELHSPIEYPVCLISQATPKTFVVNFFQYLKSDVSKQIFRQYGFIPYD